MQFICVRKEITKINRIYNGTRSFSLYFEPKRRSFDAYVKRKATPITLQQMIAMTAPKVLVQTSDSLGEELRTRIAHRIRDMEQLPSTLTQTQSVAHVINLYKEFFKELCAVGHVQTQEEHDKFCSILSQIKSQDSRTLPAMAYGIQEWQKEMSSGLVNNDVARILDRMFTARLSIRMLIGQHTEAHENGYGRIQRNLRVVDVAKEAADLASRMCLEKFKIVPQVEFIEASGEVKMTYVKSHMHHIVFELLKNSMRAVVENHMGEEGIERRSHLTLPKRIQQLNDSEGAFVLPPIRVIVSGGDEDVVIKVTDLGGGVPRSGMKNIWSYQYTTATSADIVPLQNNKEFDQKMDMAYHTFRESFFGLGYGLPISRVFARYFGGDLNLHCTEGWGTDAYVHLKKLESTAVEQIMVLPD